MARELCTAYRLRQNCSELSCKSLLGLTVDFPVRQNKMGPLEKWPQRVWQKCSQTIRSTVFTYEKVKPSLPIMANLTLLIRPAEKVNPGELAGQ